MRECSNFIDLHAGFPAPLAEDFSALNCLKIVSKLVSVNGFHIMSWCSANIFCKLKESLVAQSCPTLCDPMDCSLPGSSIHGVFQAKVLESVAISFSRGSSWPRDRTRVSYTIGRRFTVWATREAELRRFTPLHQIKENFFFYFFCTYFLRHLFPGHKFLFLQFLLGYLFLLCNLLFWFRNNLFFFNKDHLNVAGRAHVGVGPTVSSVSPAPHFGDFVHLDVL